jgi:hypothetical protein
MAYLVAITDAWGLDVEVLVEVGQGWHQSLPVGLVKIGPGLTPVPSSASAACCESEDDIFKRCFDDDSSQKSHATVTHQQRKRIRSCLRYHHHSC